MQDHSTDIPTNVAVSPEFMSVQDNSTVKPLPEVSSELLKPPSKLTRSMRPFPCIDNSLVFSFSLYACVGGISYLVFVCVCLVPIRFL